MNIKSEDFLRATKISEDKGTRFALIGVGLGAISIFIALNKDFKFILIFYGALIMMIFIFSLITGIKEVKFYKSLKIYDKEKMKSIFNFIIDSALILFGLALVIYPYIFN